MDDRRTTDFASARRFEHELSDRQREVLALIERGHTNAEIAAQLELPLTAVKWHVSEVLAKLGFSSREEAAEYWRWRTSAGSQLRFRAVSLLGFGFGLKKALAVTAGGLATAGAGALVALSVFGPNEPGVVHPPVVDEPGQPFYLEATYTTTQPPALILQTDEEREVRQLQVDVYRKEGDIILRDAADAAPSGPSISATSAIRWWLADPVHWKWERDFGSTRRLQAADGESMFSYPLGPTSYMRHPLSSYSTRIRDGYIGEIPMLGPSRARDLGELLAALREGTEAFAEVVGYETVLGRDTTVIRYGPQGMDPTDNGADYRGEGRIWLDEERMMVMKSERDLGNGHTYAVEVTRLDWGYVPAPAEVALVPPPGTTENQALPLVTDLAPGEIREVER